MRAYESALIKFPLTVLDRDKFSSNSYLGDAGSMVANLMTDAPQKDERG